ncbi:hypothetical protein CYMTET_42193, partial [Cymbomonas tetramitiformis]
MFAVFASLLFESASSAGLPSAFEDEVKNVLLKIAGYDNTDTMSIDAIYQSEHGGAIAETTTTFPDQGNAKIYNATLQCCITYR